MVRATTVFVTGASELPEEHISITRELGHRLMTDTGFVLLTGGLASKANSNRQALDKIVAEAALETIGVDAAQARIVTMLPESDSPDLKRFEIGTVVRASYASPKTRRYSMVLTSDAVIAVHGADSTREVIDLAYVAGKPLIPIPATGGTSLESWNRYAVELTNRLRLHPEQVQAIRDGRNQTRIVSTCLEILSRVLRPRCFVAMPFTSHPLPNTFETIRAVGEELGFQVIRVDQENFIGNIVEVIWDEIRHSDIVVADLTDHNPNVYYEMGIAHALGKPTLLTFFSKNGGVPRDIPFDIRIQRIVPYGTTQSLQTQLRDILPVAAPTTKKRAGARR